LCARPAQTVQKRPHALAQITVIHGRREENSVSHLDSRHYSRKVVIDGTMTFFATSAPAHIVALTASLNLFGRKEDYIAYQLSTGGNGTFYYGVHSLSSLACPVT
jgi:hypothetical protein